MTVIKPSSFEKIKDIGQSVLKQSWTFYGSEIDQIYKNKTVY
jgi:hypothetical protein